MKSTRKWIAAIMAVLMLVLMAACGNGGNAANENKAGYRTLEEIKAAGTINIGVFSDKNPFGYVDENGEYQGYDVYFARRLAEDLGVKVNFISTEAANRIEYLKTGKVDVILANFTVTPCSGRGSGLRAALHECSTGRCFSGRTGHHHAGGLG